eukprot:2675693-Lingulodinium_polyedra.AAC.1
MGSSKERVGATSQSYSGVCVHAVRLPARSGQYKVVCRSRRDDHVCRVHSLEAKFIQAHGDSMDIN